MQRTALLSMLAERDVRRGTVTLASGVTNDFYIDCKQVTLSAAGARLTGGLVFEHIQTLRAQGVRIDSVGGTTLGADPIAVAASLISAQAGQPVDSFVTRKDSKGHGTLFGIKDTAPVWSARACLS